MGEKQRYGSDMFILKDKRNRIPTIIPLLISNLKADLSIQHYKLNNKLVILDQSTVLKDPFDQKAGIRIINKVFHQIFIVKGSAQKKDSSFSR